MTFGWSDRFYDRSGTSLATGVAVSSPVFHQGRAYFTSSDGKLDTLGGWSVPTSGGCAASPAPAAAYGAIFAGGCSTIGSYQPGTGATNWAVTTPGEVMGVTVANDLVYACADYSLYVYDAFSGGLLLPGGALCTEAPVVVNGTVYTTDGNLNASDLSAENVDGVRDVA